MRILISGGAGFLGSHLTDLLLGQGHEVIAADNFITGKPDNVAHLRGHPRHRLIKHDVTQPLELDGPIDRIYHMASPASPMGYVKHQVATMKVNSEGTWKLNATAIRRSTPSLNPTGVT
jgi:nucleoside-diphosphate-sugar epimerase